MILVRLLRNLKNAIIRQINENENLILDNSKTVDKIREEQLKQREDLEDIKARLYGLHELTGTVLYTVKITQDSLMTGLQEVFDAIDTTGRLIVERVNAEAADLQALIQNMQANSSGVTSADLQQIIDRVGAMGSLVGDSVAALVPTLPTPETPTPPAEPVPLPPEGSPDVPELPPLPDVEVPIDVVPTDPGVGVDGGFELTPAEETGGDSLEDL